MSGAAAAFIDRDGVINQLVPDPLTGHPESPLRVADVALLPGAGDGLRRLASAGWRLVGVSNQPAAAKGLISLADIWAIQARVVDLLAADGAALDDFRICLHHPDGVVPELTGACRCRKPTPGLLVAAAADLHLDLARSWMVGDTDADVLAGRAAGCRTVLIEHPGSAHKRAGAARPDEVVSDLATAADFILAARG